MRRPTKEFQAFDHAVRQPLTLPKTASQRRHCEHRERRRIPGEDAENSKIPADTARQSTVLA